MGWGLRTAVSTQCHSAQPCSSRAGPTPSPQHSEAMLLPGVMDAGVSTRGRAPLPARAPALPLPNGPLCSCAGIMPRVRGSHICAHTCSLQAGVPLSIPKFCLRMPGAAMHGGGNPAPTHPPARPTHTLSRAARHRQARAPALRRSPLHARRLRGCVHTRPSADLQHTNCWEGEKKKQPHRFSRERWGGGEREKERMTDCNPP